MKLVTAVIKPFKLDDVKAGLETVGVVVRVRTNERGEEAI